MSNFIERPFINQTYFKCNNEGIPYDKDPVSGTEAKDHKEMLRLNLPADIIGLDIDDRTIAIKISAILRIKNIKHYEMKTDRGVHYYFATPKNKKDIKQRQSKNYVSMLNVGKMDGKPGYYNGQLCVMKNGVGRSGDIAPENNLLTSNDLDEMPCGLGPIKKDGQDSFLGMVEGSRETELYKGTKYLMKNKLNCDQIREILFTINNNVLEDPLPQSELENSVLREVTPANILTEGKQNGGDKNTFLHVKFIEEFLKRVPIVQYNGLKYFYNGKYYEFNDQALEIEFVKLDDSLRIAHRKEALAYLKLLDLSDVSENIITNDKELKYMRVLSNGILNCKTLQFIEHTSKYFLTKMLDVKGEGLNYKDEKLDRALNQGLCEGRQFGLEQDTDNRTLGEAGWSTVVCSDSTDWKKGICILGGSEADNGKSTFADVLLNFFRPNIQKSVSYISIDNLSPTRNLHDLSTLIDKLLIYNDEAPTKAISDDCMITLKVMSSPNAKISCRRAFDPNTIDFTFTGKVLVAGNEPVYTSRKTNDGYNKLIVIPFGNKFTGKDANKDLVYELKTESCKSYLLSLAVNAFQNLLKTNEFPISKCAIKALGDYKCANDSVLKGIDRTSKTENQLVNKGVQEAYEDYKCGLRAVNDTEMHRGKNSFVVSIRQHFGIVPKIITLEDGKEKEVFSGSTFEYEDK